MQSDLERKLLDSDVVSIGSALDELYGPRRRLQETSTNRRTLPFAMLGLLAVLLGLGVVGFRGDSSALASVERTRIKRVLVELPDFFESVEDGDDRTAALTQILVGLPQPQYEENRGIWADAALRVFGLLAVEASRAGRWQLSRVYEAEARSLLPQVISIRSFEASCVVEYAEGRRRHEEALSSTPRNIPTLKQNAQRLTAFLEAVEPLGRDISEKNLVAFARLQSLAAISTYKSGLSSPERFFSGAEQKLMRVEPSYRDIAWAKAFARNAADWSLYYARSFNFSAAREKLSEGIRELERHEDDPYLLGLLYANRADSWYAQYRSTAVTRDEVLSMTGSEVADRRAARQWFAEPAKADESVNRRENRTLNLSRLAFAYCQQKKWDSALQVVRELETTVDNVDSFVNPQLSDPLRIALNLVVAGDRKRSKPERLAAAYLAMTRLGSAPYVFEEHFLNVYEAQGEQVPSSLREEMKMCLAEQRKRAAAQREASDSE